MPHASAAGSWRSFRSLEQALSDEPEVEQATVAHAVASWTRRVESRMSAR
jgi:hypothetical protein